MSDGKDIAIVIGGAGAIGAACSRILAREGFRVVVIDQARERAEEVCEAIGGVAFEADLSNADDLERCRVEIAATTGPASVLVNSAGVIQGPVRPNLLPNERWDQIVDVNQRGVFLSCVAFSRDMLRRKHGSIVNIASIAGMRSLPLHAYAPSKAAVISMTECLAAEWGPRGVRVNCVSPGFTRTLALQRAIDAGTTSPEPLIQDCALNRLVEPEEVAEAVGYLCSDRARAITGINLPVDCGWLVGSTWRAYGGLRE